MDALTLPELILIALCFVWSGFVRSALGFGGAALTLPFLLLILNEPLVFLPIISVQLLFFSTLTLALAHWRQRGKGGGKFAGDSVDWGFLKQVIPIMLVPKLLGVAGVIVMPGNIVSGIILVIVMGYAISYLLNRPIQSRGGFMDAVLLALGGYASGVSLVGAPLVVPVAAARVEAVKLRDTLFVLWFILVVIKLSAFAWSGVDLQLRHNLWLLPCGTLGHLVGIRFHRYSLRADTSVFMRYLGSGLLLVSLAGVVKLFVMD